MHQALATLCRPHYNASVPSTPPCDTDAASDLLHWDPVLIGTLCGLFSAAGYAAANICLRLVTHCDPVWVSCVKAAPTLVLFAPMVASRVLGGKMVVPSLRMLGVLVVAAIVGQFGGNVVFQWSLGKIGLALSVPLCLGAMILGGAAMGRWFLGERITSRMSMAIIVLLVAIFVLSLGASAAHESLLPPDQAHHDADVWAVTLGVAAACLSGLGYCYLGVTIRYAARAGTPLPTILLVSGVIGVVLLGGTSAVQIGPSAWLQTAPGELGIMLLAGVFNALSFWALSKALHLTGVVYVNALNASQSALAALAGVLLFSEAVTGPLIVGATLTALGLLLMRGGHAQHDVPAASAHVGADAATPLVPSEEPG